MNLKKISLLLYAFLFLSLTNFSYGQDQEGMHYGAKETFKYWAGEEPWEGIDVRNGQYWSSSHFTKEYIMYMEVIVPIEMALSFINDKYNRLELVDEEVKFPSDAPEWFQPPTNYKEYKGGNQGSKYFINTETGHMFMYEIQL